MVVVAGDLKDKGLEGDQGCSGVTHGLDSNIPVVVVHRSACIHNQVHVVVFLKQIKASLAHTNMGFASVENDLVSSGLSLQMIKHWLLKH